MQDYFFRNVRTCSQRNELYGILFLEVEKQNSCAKIPFHSRTHYPLEMGFLIK